jgi:transcriptional regulator
MPVPHALSLVRGSLDVLVLKALSWTPKHGFEITCWLEERSDQRLEIEDSALYHALNRLEGKGLIEAEWGITENNRRARYYALTVAGRAELDEQTQQWLQYADTLRGILTIASQGT